MKANPWPHVVPQPNGEWLSPVRSTEYEAVSCVGASLSPDDRPDVRQYAETAGHDASAS